MLIITEKENETQSEAFTVCLATIIENAIIENYVITGNVL